ncbi:50S ribosomal protein L32 [Candidatus Falkowbacteria bacterium CG_4_9_14_3_um_filter_36_9]|uniref:Large ribosomal subunit protein bL32 n=2 Tax=Candidatus Falkowiibacteriota TaxID=1752728 RepID=A0A1J4T8I3_9BACT|nr:MAG: 50S ribosomal protein L32 [Candidatus Falkowbacteria bacterium CG1_02_37_44]PIV52183.1 MAG: 50S ribosomal protein L32 [Candidatus Falkowbacteria bacterium CG02_land_8_20_14_3_00_36_14]PJA10609.1 MAG: 50S ribosomal protein L32 [Candidatus Falkowbacteria bacterium CG_4_10_14_0_2_um_filter_36_22]PJB18458.1 MAG: 50S ribosomal protein L32 [Candidatus Falkowbacteria bacterium CG_4_9_14_3_um_filter_36_9]
MSVPAKRKSSSRARKGRSHLALKKINLNRCPKCAKTVLPHRACGFCGTYKGKEVIKSKSIKTKKQENKKT